MNVDIKHFPSRSLLITPSDGSSTLRELSLNHVISVNVSHFRRDSHRLGVPYHSWRITHAKHHASTGHMTQDQVFVPKTRLDLGLPPFDPSGENILGSSVTEKVRKELWEALGDSPIGAALLSAGYLVSIYREISFYFTDNLVDCRMACIPYSQRFGPATVPSRNQS